MFKPKATTVRQVVVPVKPSEQKKRPPQRPPGLSTPAQRLAQDATRDRAGRKASPGTPGKNNKTNGTHGPVERAKASSSALKRKRNGTPQTPDWAEDEDEEDADLEEESKRLQRRKPKNDSLEPDTRRDTWLKDTVISKDDVEGLVHGADFTSGVLFEETGISPDIYKPHFDLEETDEIPVVEVQYPSNSPPERFQLVYPHDDKEYRPMVDIYESVDAILKYYFPPEKQESLLHPDTGLTRRLKIAVNHRRLADFRSTLSEFNDLVRRSLADGTIYAHLDTQHTLPIALIERILEHQTYERTVAPHVAKLKVRKEELKNEKSKTYGEIKPRFAHDIFREARLRSGHVFVDLGSGVGNVVLQAALEAGAESHGVEIVDMPARCAAAQLRDFEARCRLWGVRPGAVSLARADFLKSPEVDAVLRRADVVLVNNRVFEPPLNDALVLKFLDLKEGCRVVSLEKFVPEKWEMRASNMHDVRNTLRTRELWYGADRVSWAYEGGSWYITTKDSSAVAKFAERKKRLG